MTAEYNRQNEGGAGNVEKAKVYFTDFRTKLDVSQGTKLQNLCRKAGISSIDFDGKFVAIKLHFGELGTLPIYGRTTSELLRIWSRNWAGSLS